MNQKKIVDTAVREELTEVVQSDIVEVLKQIKAARREQYPDEFGNDGSGSELDAESGLGMETALSEKTAEKLKKSEKGADPKKAMLIPKFNPANISAQPNTVGEVQPNYGVRMKSNLKNKGEGTRHAGHKAQTYDSYERTHEREESLDGPRQVQNLT